MSYIEVLQSKRDDVRQQLQALREQMAELTSQVAVRENQLRNIDDLLSLEGSTINPDERDHREPASSSSRRLVDQAYRVLSDESQPLHYRELTRRLTDSGAYIPGQDPAANLLTQITRDSRFARAAARGVYGLAEWPALAAARRRGSKAKR